MEVTEAPVALPGDAVRSDAFLLQGPLQVLHPDALPYVAYVQGEIDGVFDAFSPGRRRGNVLIVIRRSGNVEVRGIPSGVAATFAVRFEFILPMLFIRSRRSFDTRFR